jgi:REP element-mobilizing transposase RayT
MTRPLRLAFPGALHHITARGNRQHRIYHDDTDRLVWLDMLATICRRHQCITYSFCQMTNHYHLMIETVDANLSQAMRQLNGLYSQYVNRRHGLAGHLFQGRFHAVLVQKQTYLQALSRYIVLNPVRARMVSSVDEWPWSSHPYMVSSENAPAWLDRDWLLGQFGETRQQAIAAYQSFIVDGVGAGNPLNATRHQVLLGDDDFVTRHQDAQRSVELVETMRDARRAVALPLIAYQARYACRDEAMAQAYLSTAYTMTHIAQAFGVSTKTVSRAVAAFDRHKSTGE